MDQTVLQTQQQFTKKQHRQNTRTNATKRKPMDKRAPILILVVSHLSYLNQDQNNGNLSSVNIMFPRVEKFLKTSLNLITWKMMPDEPFQSC